MTEQDRNPESLPRNAERLFAHFLVQQEADPALEFESFCEQHPDSAEDLRKLHEDWQQIAGVMGQLGATDSGQHRVASTIPDAVSRPNAPPSTPILPDGITDRKGSFDRYDVIGEVARGGMGVILHVFDRDLCRNLAMKVTLDLHGQPTQVISDSNVDRLGRFLDEAKVTAQLDHPGIVPVHELGLDKDDQLYFTMKLVNGETLGQVLRRYHRGESDWTQPRVLNILLKLCEAMAYAHDKGVIHRDLKPANVMVGSFGEVYVMDWGLARDLAKPDSRDLRLASPSSGSEEGHKQGSSPIMTMEGDVIGTPVYMSPEQAAGRIAEVDRRSDVYSIGIILYQFLTGRVPFVEEDPVISPQQILARVIHESPVPVSTLAGESPPELLAICEKSMARNSTDRYATMGELASDLRAFLEHRVVQAYRTGALVELKKWVQRNRAMATAAAAAVLIAVTSSVVIALQNKKLATKTFALTNANTSLRLTTVDLRTAQADLALRNDELESRNAELQELVATFDDLLTSPNPYEDGNQNLTVRELLQRRLPRALERLQKNPELRGELQGVGGQTYFALGLYAEAEFMFRTRLEWSALNLGSEHRKTLQTQNALALCLNAQSRFDEAEGLFRAALETSRRALGDEQSTTLTMQHNLAACLRAQGRSIEAEKIFLSVLEAKRRLFGEDHPSTLLTQGQLALCVLDLGRYAEAEEIFQAMLTVSLRVLGEEHPQTLTAQRNLAVSLYDLGRFAEAERTYQAVLEVSLRVLGEEHPSTLSTRSNVAACLLEQGQAAKAEKICRTVLEARRRVLGDEHAETLATHGTLADCLWEQGRFAEAEAIYRTVLEAKGRVLGETHPDTLTTQHNLASCLLSQGHFTEAEEICRTVLGAKVRELGEEHPDTLATQGHLADCLYSQGRFGEAEEFYREVLEVKRRVLGEDHAGTLTEMHNLAACLLSQNRFVEAEETCRTVLEARRRVLGEGHPTTKSANANLTNCVRGILPTVREALVETERDLGAVHAETLAAQTRLSQLLVDLQQWEEAEAVLSAALEMAYLELEEDNPLIARVQSLYGRSLMGLEDFESAEEELAEAAAVLEELVGPSHESTREAMFALASLYRAWGKIELAEQWRNRWSEAFDSRAR